MAYAREGAGSQPQNEMFLNFETNRLFFVQSLPKLLSCSGGLRRRGGGGGCATIMEGGLLGSKFQNAIVCTKAHHNGHLIGSYLRSANQASSFNACNAETSFTASNW